MSTPGTGTPGTRAFEGLAIPEPGTFALDPYHTRVGFSARHLMVSKVRGEFREVSGTITVPADPLKTSAEVVIKAASIDTRVEMRDNHIRSADFLDAEKYPDISFRSTGVARHNGTKLTVAGDLTIKDVTRPVELTAEFEGVTTSPAAAGGKQVIGFSITGEIDREDWGITYNMALEAGGFMVSKTIGIEIEGEAIRQD